MNVRFCWSITETSVGGGTDRGFVGSKITTVAAPGVTGTLPTTSPAVAAGAGGVADAGALAVSAGRGSSRSEHAAAMNAAATSGITQLTLFHLFIRSLSRGAFSDERGP